MFLLQTGKDDQVLFDFQYELLESIRQNRWFYGDDEAESFIAVQSFEHFTPPGGIFVCPVGSIEFVSDYIKKYYANNAFKAAHPMRPINVPTQLLGEEFTGRFIKKGVTSSELLKIINDNKNNNYYVKSSVKIKGASGLLYPDNAIHFLANTEPGERFDVSEDLGMLRAEWRAFIFNGEILDVRRYIGGWGESIDQDFVEKAVAKWGAKPKACTLDVAKTDNGRFIVLEGHNFVSCGTYGFSDQNLPRMFVEGFKWEIKM